MESKRPSKGMRKHIRRVKAEKRRAGLSNPVVKMLRFWVCPKKTGTFWHETTCNNHNPFGRQNCTKCGARRPDAPSTIERPAA